MMPERQPARLEMTAFSLGSGSFVGQTTVPWEFGHGFVSTPCFIRPP